MARTRANASGRSRQSEISEYYNAVAGPPQSGGVPDAVEEDPWDPTPGRQNPIQRLSRGGKKLPKSEFAAMKKRWTNKRARPTWSYIPRNVGKGDYKSFFAGLGRAVQKVGQRVVPKGAFSQIGERMGQAAGGYATGSSLGAMGGGMAGKAAGSAFSRLVGFGDYEIKANTLMDLPMGTPVASFGNMSNATIVSHREFIQDIRVLPGAAGTAANFQLQMINLNPGLRSVFPWLSAVAGSYQEYQFLGCVFEFRSLSSDSATSLPLGSIIMASNYDTADPAYPDKRHMENSQFCVSGKPSLNLIHPIECDPKISFSPLKYTRTGAGAANTDNRLYDHCNVMIATEGLPTGSEDSVIGELWCTYEVALYKPQLGVVAALRDHFFDSVGIATATPFGTSANTLAPRGGTANGLGITLSLAGGIILPQGLAPGTYEISVAWAGPAGFCTVTPLFATPAASGVTETNYYLDGTSQEFVSPFPALASVRQAAFLHIDVAAPLRSAVTIACTVTFGAAPTGFDLQVAALPALQI